jgi:outer membrane protein TolC
MKASFICALTTTLLALVVPARAGVVRLEDLEVRALRKRARITADEAAAAAARAGVDVAKSAYLPTASVALEAYGSPGAHLVRVANTSGDEYLVAGSRPLGESGAFVPEARYEGFLTLQGTVYDFGRTRSAVVAAESRTALAEAKRRVTRAAVVGEVRAAYLSWLGAALLHAAAERALGNAHERVQLVETRVGAGTRPPSDLPAVRYDENVAALDECVAQRQVDDAKLGLGRAVGEPLDAEAGPDSALLDRTFPTSEARVETIMALTKERASALATARFYEHSRAPVLSAAVRAGVRGQGEQIFPDYRAGISLAVPLWDGGAGAAHAAESRQEAAAVDARAREQRAAIDVELLRAKSNWLSEGRRLTLAEALYAEAAARTRDAEQRYAVGESNLEIVLAAASNLSRAEREVILARVARTNALLRWLDPEGAALSAGGSE